MAGTLPSGTSYPTSLDGVANGYGAVATSQVITATTLNNLASAILAAENVMGPIPGTKEWKQHARVATAGVALPANTYSGTAQTLTANANGALVVDGVTVNMNDRVLVKNEATASHNGVYLVTATGSSSTEYVLTRAVDYNASALIAPASALGVSEGTVNAATAWLLATIAPITLDTSSLTYDQLGTNLTTPLPISEGGTGASTEAGAQSNLGLTQATDANLEALATGALQVTTGTGALSSVAPGTSGNVLTSNGTVWLSAAPSPTKATNSACAWYGAGVDGNANLTANTTLTRNMAYNSLTVNSGVVLNTANYRIQCLNPINLYGTIECIGGNGNGTTAGTAVVSGFFNGGGNGGAGATAGQGSAGATSSGGTPAFAQTGGSGGNGESGTETGGAGGSAVALTPANGGGAAVLQSPVELLCHVVMGSGGWNNWNASGVGGGGGGDNSGHGGGGGGAGGGTVVIATPSMVGNGTISAVGGNGANANSSGNGGGGGGGNGGLVGFIMDVALPANITVSVAGGSHGSGSGNGTAGTAGQTGATIYLLNT